MHFLHPVTTLFAFVASNYCIVVSAEYVYSESCETGQEHQEHPEHLSEDQPYAAHFSGSLAVSALQHLHAAHKLEVEAHDSIDEHVHVGYPIVEPNLTTDTEAAGAYNGAADDDDGRPDEYGETIAASEYQAQFEPVANERKDEQQLNIDEAQVEALARERKDLVGEFGAHLLYDELEHKAVPGIDHGKGAFSYSTLYETKRD